MVPGLLENLLGSVLIPQPIPEGLVHRLADIRLIVEKAPVVPFTIHPVGHLNPNQGIPFRAGRKFAEELLESSSDGGSPFAGGHTDSPHGIVVMLDDAQEAVCLFLLVSCVGVDDPFLRMSLEPPARGAHMKAEYDRSLRAYLKYTGYLLPGECQVPFVR